MAQPKGLSDFHREILRNLLCNCKAQSFDIWYVASPKGCLPRLFKLCPPGPKRPRPRDYQFFIEKSLKIFSDTVRPRAQIFCMMHHLMDVYQDCSNYDPQAKNGPAKRLISFSQVNFKKIFFSDAVRPRPLIFCMKHHLIFTFALSSRNRLHS